MELFALHSGQPPLSRFLARLRIPSGTALPKNPHVRILNLRGADRLHIPPAARRPLQPPDAVARASDERSRAEALRLNGVGVRDALDSGTLLRTYVIPVFGVDALAVFVSGGRAGSPLSAGSRRELIPADEEGPRPLAQRRAERAAVRAAYALGLDYAVVEVCLNENGEPLVVGLDASPGALAGRFAPLFADAVNRYAQTLREGNGAELLLGTDLEFVLRSPDGKIVSAANYFNRRGVVGCDGVRIGGRLVFPLAELRPSPAAEPRELLRNLRAAMRMAALRLDDAGLEWLAGGMPVKGLPLGGHIHISGVALDADLVRALDNYLALPLALLEDDGSRQRRPRYGALGDIRRQFHGGFEYRTLPSWIVSPSVALGVLSLAKVVCEEARGLRERPLARPEMQALYYAGDKTGLLPTALALWGELERTSAYAKYARELDRLKQRIERMESWDAMHDVRPAWKLTLPERRASLRG